MSKILIIAGFLTFLLSCNSEPSEKSTTTNGSNNKTSKAVEGKDYVILKRFRVVDAQGFNQPVEVSSFLLPANWQVNSAIQWNGTNKCMPEMVQASIQATSPDKEFELLMFPVTQFDWSNDAVYLDAMKRGFNMHSCNIAKPEDATGYIRKYLAPYLKAQVKTAKPIDALQQQMDEGARQMTTIARQAGNNAYSHKGSAAEGMLQFADNNEGLAFCTLMQTITTMPGTQGGMANTYQCYVSMRIVLKYKTGNEAMARKIASTFFSSSKINPQWATAVQTFFANIGRSAQVELGKQIEISRQAQEEIGNNIVRNWEKNNSSSNSTEQFNQQFGEYLRGVDGWTDDGGNKVELTSGYSNAWGKGDGSYLLSNDPSFDPNVTFNESWKRLNK